jgi:hypothetical protein
MRRRRKRRRRREELPGDRDRVSGVPVASLASRDRRCPLISASTPLVCPSLPFPFFCY